MLVFQIYRSSRSGSSSRNKPSELTGQRLEQLWNIHAKFISSFGQEYSTISNSAEQKAIIVGSQMEWRQSDPMNLTLNNGKTAPTSVNFLIESGSALGGQQISLHSVGTIIPREVEPNYNLEQRRDFLLRSSVYLGSQIVFNSVKPALQVLYPDDEFPLSLSNQLYSDVSSTFNANYSRTGLLNFASSRLGTLMQAKGANSELQTLANDNFEKISNGYTIVGLADNAGVKNIQNYSVNIYKKGVRTGKKKKADVLVREREKADNIVLKSNLELSSLNGTVPSEHLGVNSDSYVFYDHRLWESGHGIIMLTDQMNLHQIATVTFIQNGNYPSKGTEHADNTYSGQSRNLQTACAKYGVELNTSINGALADLGVLLQDTRKLSDEIIATAGGASASYEKIESAYAQLMENPEFRKRIANAKMHLSELTLRYPIARRYGPGGTDEGKYRPEALANQVGSNFLPTSLIPGYMALDYAMSWVGRGMFVMPPSEKPIQDITYLVDNNQSKLLIKSQDGQAQNSGIISTKYIVRVNKKTSLAREYPEAMKKRVLDYATNANNSNFGVQVKNVSIVEGDGYTDYVAEIHAPFSFHSEYEVNNFQKAISIPNTIYGNNIQNLRIYLITSTVRSASSPDIPTKLRTPKKKLSWWELNAGLTSLPTWGTTKSFSAFNDNVTVEDQLGQRDWSTLGFSQLYGSLGYDMPENVSVGQWGWTRSLTYLQERAGSPKKFSTSGGIWGIFESEIGFTQNQDGDWILNDFDIEELSAIYEKYKNQIYSSQTSQGIAGVLEQDSDMSGVPLNIFSDMGELKKWSPLHYEMNKWAIMSAIYQQALYATDPQNKEQVEILQDKINFYEAQRILSFPRIITPTWREASALYSVACRKIADVGEAVREHGLSATYNINRDSRVQLTVSPSLMSMGGAFNPYIGINEFGLAAKVTDATGGVLNTQLNLYKTKGDDWLFRTDVVAEVGLLYSPTEQYEWNQRAFIGFNSIESVFYVPEEQKRASLIYDAAMKMKSLLNPSRDAAERAICDQIMKYSNPLEKAYPEGNLDIKTGGQCDREIQRLRAKIYHQAKFTGGMQSEANIFAGMYINGLNTYMSKDNLATGIIPFGHVRFPVYFEKTNLPWNINMKINADIFLPPAVWMSVGKLFTEKGSVSDYILQGADMYNENWMPATPYTLNLSKALDISSGYALKLGANVVGDLGSFSFNEFSLHADFMTDRLIPGAVSSFRLTTGLEGMGIGDMDLSIKPDLQVAFPDFKVFGNDASFTARVNGLLRKGASAPGRGSTWLTNIGVGLNFRVNLGSGTSGKRTDIPVNQYSRYRDLQMPEFPITTPRAQILEQTPTKTNSEASSPKTKKKIQTNPKKKEEPTKSHEQKLKTGAKKNETTKRNNPKNKKPKKYKYNLEEIEEPLPIEEEGEGGG